MYSGLLDEAIELAKNPSNEVLFLHCGGVQEMCLFNRNGSKPLCALCSHATSKVIKKYKNISSRSLSDYCRTKQFKDHPFDYSSVEDLRAIKYKGVSIGLSVHANYITCTRNLDVAINERSKVYFDAHLRQCVRMVDAVYTLIEEYKPDCVYTYNGRFEEVRPFYDICTQLGIHYILSEVFPTGTPRWHKVQFDNHFTLDIKYFLELREYCWNHYNLTEKEKEALGRSFFEKRRNAQYAGDTIYVKQQILGKLPEFIPNKTNVAIMNSSEDEFASIGGEWEKLKIFPNQYEGIVFLLENAPANIHFYLRIHPNLKDIKYGYHTKLWDLENKYANITVIRGDSDISTYSLMDSVDKVICFGSSAGLEASYWGKPSILLGPSFYYYDDVCYVPHDKNEILELLSESLESKSNINLLKYGAYVLDSSPIFVPDRNIDCISNPRSFIGIKYHSCPTVSMWCGERVTGFLLAVLRAFWGSRIFHRFVIPLEEA